MCISYPWAQVSKCRLTVNYACCGPCTGTAGRLSHVQTHGDMGDVLTCRVTRTVTYSQGHKLM